MKSRWIAGCLALGAAAWLTGCGDDKVSTPAATAPPATADAGGGATTTEAAKAQAKDAVNAVKEAVNDAGAVAQTKFSELVAEVKKLIADGKNSEAASKLRSGIENIKLSPEQKQTLTDLLKQAQTSIQKTGAEAAKAVSEFFKKPQN